MIEVEVGGTIVEFPDGTAPEVMKAALQKRFGAPEKPAAPTAGPIENALKPITDYPATYNQMQRESRELMSEGVNQMGEGGVANAGIGAVKTVLGGFGYAAAPITAAYRSVIGQPVENITGIPKEYTEFGAQLVTPVIGLTRLPRLPPKPPAITQPGQQVAAAGDRLGVDLPLAVTSDSVVTQQAGKTVANVPWVGKPLVDASTSAIDDLGEAALQARAAYGSGNPAIAGTGVREGVTTAIKSGPIKQRVTELYDRVDGLVNPVTTGDLPNTRNLVNTIDARRINAALPKSSSTQELSEALGRGGMNYEGIKDLRSYFGEMLDGGIPIPQGMSQNEVKQIYGALSDDMRLIIAKAGGKDGLRAYQQAEAAAKRWAGIREDLGRLLKVQSEEAIFDKVAAMAGSTARADLSLLGRVRGAVGPQNWDEVSSAVIGRMGWPAGGTGFSPDAFLTAYKKMSPEGRRLLFRSTNNASHAQAIDDIAKVSERFKELNKFANPSGTGQTVSTLAAGGAAASSGKALLAGSFLEPITTVSTIVGGRIMSHVLARPAPARAMANWAKDYEAAARRPTPANMNKAEASAKVFAATIGRDFGRPDLAPEFLRRLQGTVPAPAEDEQN